MFHFYRYRKSEVIQLASGRAVPRSPEPEPLYCTTRENVGLQQMPLLRLDQERGKWWARPGPAEIKREETLF